MVVSLNFFVFILHVSAKKRQKHTKTQKILWTSNQSDNWKLSNGFYVTPNGCKNSRKAMIDHAKNTQKWRVSLNQWQCWFLSPLCPASSVKLFNYTCILMTLYLFLHCLPSLFPYFTIYFAFLTSLFTFLSLLHYLLYFPYFTVYALRFSPFHSHVWITVYGFGVAWTAVDI